MGMEVQVAGCRMQNVMTIAGDDGGSQTHSRNKINQFIYLTNLESEDSTNEAVASGGYL